MYKFRHDLSACQFRFSSALPGLGLVLPENWVHLLVGVEPKDTNKPKIGRRKYLLLAASKENTGDLSQSSVSSNSKAGEVLS